MSVQQGEVYYAYLGPKTGSGPAGWHYVVIVQSDTMNRTKVRTAVGCVLTSKLKRGKIAGNVTIPSSDSGLPERSVVNISQVVTLDKLDLTDKRGEIDEFWMEKIIRNLHRTLLRGKKP